MVDRLAGVVEQAARLVDGLARDDHAGRAGEALRRRHLGQGQAPAVGGHGPQLRLAVLDHGVEVEAVQVVARLLGGDREAGLVDQPDQVGGVDGDRIGEPLGRHHREVAGRQHRQVEARAPGLHRQARILAGVAQRDVGALRQLADDLVEGVRRRGDLAGALDLGRARVGDLHVEVGGREGDAGPGSADSSTFERIGIVLRRSTTLCTCPSAFNSAARSIVSFIQVRSGIDRATPPAEAWTVQISEMATGHIRRNRARRKGSGLGVDRRAGPAVAGGGVGVLGDGFGGLGAGRSPARRRPPWPGARSRPNSS